MLNPQTQFIHIISDCCPEDKRNINRCGVYDQFRGVDDVAIWGINDGETPEQVQKFLEEHQPPWPILLDRRREVRKA